MLNKAYIDLGALKNNALAVKEKLNSGVKFCAVVKADAYGHGACPCANALYSIADCFAVALLEEAIALRQSGIDKEILLLIEPFSCELAAAIRHNLTIAVSSAKKLREIALVSKRLNRAVKVHIKVNTGMNRQGVNGIEEINRILEIASKNPLIKIDGVFSHFACPENEKLRNRALDKFLLANTAVKGYNNKVTAHISASGGFLSGVQADMVRIGILLYGYKPFESDLVRVNPVMKVVAPIITKRRLRGGERALYGDYALDCDSDFALVRYGYADGLFRREIDGQINNRCMDLTAVSGGFDGVNEVTVLSDAEKTAKQYNTISYEILCRAASRAEKIYLR